MTSIVRWAASFRLLVVGLAAGVLILGATQLATMPVDALPEFAPPYVEVQTEALGLSAEEVEQLITVPLEADLLNGVAWMEEIRSESIPGLSSIVMTFEPGTDVIRARQMVAERLTQAHALPNVSKPPAMLQPLSSENRLMIVSLRSDDVPLIDMSVLARWNIRPRLMGVPGVANVAIWGQRERQLQVLVDPRELQEQGVSLEHVIKSTGNALWVSPLTFLEASTPGTGGFIETPNQRLGIQHILPINSPEDLARVVVEHDVRPGSAAEPRLRIGDVATVVEEHQPLIGDALVGPASETGLLLVIEKFPGVSSLDVTREVEAALESMKPGLRGIDIDTSVFRPANFLEQAIGNVSVALLAGLLLAAAAIALLLFEWRVALIAIVAIPVSMAGAIAALWLTGASLNVMVLAGLLAALGVIVDDAITGVDNVMHRLREPQTGDANRSRRSVIVEAIVEGRTPFGYATAVILLAVAPLLVVGGAIGVLLPPLALAYAFAIVASTIVALTLTPAIAVLLLAGRPVGRRQSPLVARLGRRYRGALAALLTSRRSPAVLAGAVIVGVIALAGVALVPRPNGLALPTFNAREVLIQWDAAPGTSREAMVRTIARVTAELRAINGVGNVGSHVGRAILSDTTTDVNTAEIWVTIDDGADHATAMEKIRETAAGYPGLSTTVASYPERQVGHFLPNAAHDVYARVYGQDLTVLNERATAIRDAMGNVPGVENPRIDTAPLQPSINVEVDLAAAERYGVKAGDVRRTATTLLSGIETGLLYEEQKVFEVVVWGKPELRESISNVRNLPIELPSGGLVRLDEVADVSIAPTPTSVRREGVLRYVDVGATVVGRSPDAVMADVRAAIQSVDFPLEYHAEVFSPAADRAGHDRVLAITTVGAALIAFLLLQAAIGSWLLAALFAATLPLSLAGGVVLGFLGGELASVGSLAGALLVLAISIRTGLAVIHRDNRLRRAAGGAFDPGTIVRGADDRLQATLASAFATLLAFAPFAILGGAAGLEIARPLALFVVGGLFSSTLVSLFIVPTAYLHAGPSPAADVERAAIEQLALEPATD